jgi:deoxycytidylate deaminase
MASPKGDPTYIKDKDNYFISIASAISKASTHPSAPGGCVIVRGREIIGDGRSLYTDSKIEIDCISYAIAAAAKSGNSTVGATIYSTRYPFATSIFQAHLMGIRKIVFLQHMWEPFYKDEFRRAARLARELQVAIEPIYSDEDKRFTSNTNHREDDSILQRENHSFTPDEYDSDHAKLTDHEDSTSV